MDEDMSLFKKKVKTLLFDACEELKMKAFQYTFTSVSWTIEPPCNCTEMETCKNERYTNVHIIIIIISLHF